MARTRQAAHNAPAVIPPQGRLTLTTATPVMTAEAAAQTTIYYTPHVGDVVPLYNGTEWQNFVFTELSIAMAASANWAANSNFDLFVYNDAGTLRLVTGAAWTNATTRAEALVRTNGIWLNNASFTGRYGAASTVSIAASRATYVGTMRTTGSTGTTTWELGGAAAGGDPGFLYVWNCYNRVKVGLMVKDIDASWTYSSVARSKNNSTNNRVSFVAGLNEDAIDAICIAQFSNDTGGGNAWCDINYDATGATGGDVSGFATYANIGAYYMVFCCITRDSGLGYHFLQAVETSNAVGTTTWLGDAGPANGISFNWRA